MLHELYPRLSAQGTQTKYREVVSIHGERTYISYQDPMDTGARMTKAPMAHGPADSAEGK
jgi:hypothetical protein